MKQDRIEPARPACAQVCVIGLGYVGLPAAAMWARSGLATHGVDVDARVLDAVREGRCHVVEPGLGETVAAAVAAGKLTVGPQPIPADAFVIAVPTPFHHDGSYRPDISYVEAAARSIAAVLAPGNLVILESTSPVGTTRHIAGMIRALRPDLAIGGDGEDAVDFAYSPERVIPGRTMIEIVENDRIVGGMTARAATRGAALYGAFVRGECKQTDDRTAEMVKLSENTFRDVNIALANELANICDRLGAIDPLTVIELANCHPRVRILQPGPGVGGHCISVDPWFLVASAPDDTPLIRAARGVNDGRKDKVVEAVAALLEAEPSARALCMGLSYKADIDDFRESPALEIALKLSSRFPGRVLATDPMAPALLERDVRATALTIVGLEQGVAACDLLVPLVGHTPYRTVERPDGVGAVDVIGLWRERPRAEAMVAA